MIEAVGHEHLTAYFQTLGAMVKPGGRVVIQARGFGGSVGGSARLPLPAPRALGLAGQAAEGEDSTGRLRSTLAPRNEARSPHSHLNAFTPDLNCAGAAGHRGP